MHLSCFLHVILLCVSLPGANCTHFQNVPDSSSELRVDKHRALGQVALRVLLACRAAGQFPGAGDGEHHQGTRMEVCLHCCRRRRIWRKG